MAYSTEELELENMLVGRLLLVFVSVWFTEVVGALIAVGAV